MTVLTHYFDVHYPATMAEWTAFVGSAKDGEFDIVS